MNQNTILVFIPDNLNTKLSGYLTGTKSVANNAEVFYITSETPSNNAENCVAYMGLKNEYDGLKEDISLFINNANRKLFLKCEKKRPVTQIIYDFKRFKHSDIIYKNSDYGQHFKNLSIYLREHVCLTSENDKSFGTKILSKIILIFNIFLHVLSRLNLIVKKSATLTHLEESLRSGIWFLRTAVLEKTVTPKMGNFIISKPIDIIVGMCVASYAIQFQDHIFLFLLNSFQGIVSNLKGLLFYLMGSPIGLKLNYDFNNFLGQFFIYHISLWGIFLQFGFYPLLVDSFKYIIMIDTLGFSYQVAILSDVMAIATFHSYCIYVNSARIFNMQLKCLSSLWRVVIGRKFNPLRNRVDSCQYSHTQLFIGTLSFTILLYLLPTTTLYYVVFSIFRLVILFVDRLLLEIRNALHKIPVYSIILWILNTSSVAGNINIIWKSFDEEGHITLEAKLDKLPLRTCITIFVPNSFSDMTNQRSIKDVFHGVITGAVL